MNKHIFWWNKLSHKKKWNLSINYINHYEDLKDIDILEIYNKQHPKMRKLIDIKEEDVQPLKILAVKANKDLKNYIQDVLSEHVLKAKK
jgi:hypothetical protein